MIYDYDNNWPTGTKLVTSISIFYLKLSALVPNDHATF